MLNEFVEKILVHERAGKAARDTTQEVEIYFNFVGRYIPPALQPVPLTPEEQKNCGKRRNARTGFTRTTCAARPTASRRSGKNATTPSARQKWRRQRPQSGRGYGEGHFYHRQPVTQTGAAQGHRIGQCRSLTITVQRRMSMSKLTYTRCEDYYIPDLKLSEQ